MDLFSRRQVVTVSELLDQLRRVVEDRWDFVWVEGEISGLRRPGSGHVYFALTDADAALKAVLFRHQAALVRFALEDGQEVLCQGRLSVYSPRGDVQLVVDAVEPRGAGALALAFEQVKRRLVAEGLCDTERKKALPELPRRVAVVTSPTGAAIRDFLQVLQRRFAGVEVAVYPVKVQGQGAAAEMVQALSDLAAWGWPEVVVLTRGGGSAEDLAAFNDEALARAVAACPLPTVSAVGHEVDVSITDLVADLRAPTPSAAAELLVQSRAQLLRQVAGLAGRLSQAGPRMVARRRERVAGLARALGDPRRRLGDRRLRVDDLLSRAGHALLAGLHRRARSSWRLRERLVHRRPDRALAASAARRAELAGRLAAAGRGLAAGRRERLAGLSGRLEALSPLKVLGRGYALVQDQEGRVLRRAAEAAPGQRIRVRLGRGELGAQVTEVKG